MKKSYSFYLIKSRLFPLSKQMQRIESFIELFPRRRYKIKMDPIQEIAVLDTKKGAFKSLGYSPRFELVSDLEYKQGWYYVEVALTNNNGNRSANLYAIDRNGYEHCIPISSNLRGTVREIFYIPSGIIALFWSPTASFGFFSQSGMLLHKISWLESYLRRSFRVLFDYSRFQEKHNISDTFQTLFELLFNVQKGYIRTKEERISRTVGNDYKVFLKKYGKFSSKQMKAIKNEIKRWNIKILFSFVIICDDSEYCDLYVIIDSIKSQLYPHWELLILLDPYQISAESNNKLKTLSKLDNRIKLISSLSSQDNAQSLNIAMSQCSGDYVTFVEKRDSVHKNALYRIMQSILKNSDVKMIYSDSDLIDENGTRKEPCFKPDWNPNLFYSCDYIGRICFYNVLSVREIGGFKSGYDGAEEYEFTLRLVSKLSDQEIVHIPKILYHQYCLSSEIPSYSRGRIRQHESGKKALNNHFMPLGSSVVNGAADKLYRVKYPLINLPLVSIIIPTKDKIDILKMCIDSIVEHTEYPNWEIIIIDNNSIEVQTHNYLTKISTDQRISVYPYYKPFNYAELNNFALTYARGQILTLLNNDIEIISRGWLSEMVRHVQRPEIGIVGAKLLYSDKIVQHAGVIIGIGGVAGHGHKYISDDDSGYCDRAVVVQNVSAVTGACMCVRREIYESVGGLDENLAVAFNDVDFCLKVRDAGYRNIYTPYAKLIHHESISRGHDDTPKKHALFLKEFSYMKEKWGDKLKNDPAYNPNLTHNFENFGWRD